MKWLSENWVWVLVVGAMIGMHLFGHGAHGAPHERAKPVDKDDQQRASRQASEHRH